ncbi:hypothetical protein ACQR50_02575 [Sphingomonas sp. Xoc002]|uniref:hypothetical protein n=1 Tax=Sphingomonas sp. Xoc002 TaxID=2837624 RepID=UPI003D17AC98
MRTVSFSLDVIVRRVGEKVTAKRSFATLCIVILGVALIVSIHLSKVGASADDGSIQGSIVQVVSSGAAPPQAKPPSSIGRVRAPRLAPEIQHDPMANMRAAELARISDVASPFFGYDPNLKSLHDRLRAEGRDEAWASRSEDMLAKEYADMSGIKGTDQAPHIHCGATLCEVSGSLDFPLRDIAMKSVQAPEFSERMWARGYHPMNQGFGPGKDGRQMFIGYFRREAPIIISKGQ